MKIAIGTWVRSEWFYGVVEGIIRARRNDVEGDEVAGWWLDREGFPLHLYDPFKITRGSLPIDQLEPFTPTEEEEARWCEARILG